MTDQLPALDGGAVNSAELAQASGDVGAELNSAEDLFSAPEVQGPPTEGQQLGEHLTEQSEKEPPPTMDSLMNEVLSSEGDHSDVPDDGQEGVSDHGAPNSQSEVGESRSSEADTPEEGFAAHAKQFGISEEKYREIVGRYPNPDGHEQEIIAAIKQAQNETSGNEQQEGNVEHPAVEEDDSPPQVSPDGENIEEYREWLRRQQEKFMQKQQEESGTMGQKEQADIKPDAAKAAEATDKKAGTEGSTEQAEPADLPEGGVAYSPEVQQRLQDLIQRLEERMTQEGPEDMRAIYNELRSGNITEERINEIEQQMNNGQSQDQEAQLPQGEDEAAMPQGREPLSPELQERVRKLQGELEKRMRQQGANEAEINAMREALNDEDITEERINEIENRLNNPQDQRERTEDEVKEDNSRIGKEIEKAQKELEEAMKNKDEKAMKQAQRKLKILNFIKAHPKLTIATILALTATVIPVAFAMYAGSVAIKAEMRGGR